MLMTMVARMMMVHGNECGDDQRDGDTGFDEDEDGHADLAAGSDDDDVDDGDCGDPKPYIHRPQSGDFISLRGCRTCRWPRPDGRRELLQAVGVYTGDCNLSMFRFRA